MTFELPSLPYAYDALAPVIDEKTMITHHTKHHQGYTNKLNALIDGTEYTDWPIEKLFAQMQSLPLAVRIGVGNNGGGYYNHCLFWQCMVPGGKEMSPVMKQKLEESFGSVESFKETFADAAKTQFGSGWAWLVQMDDSSLEVCSTANQYNPLMEGHANQGQPLLGLDVWEHAYYLHYQNRRADYVDSWWSIVNWTFVEEQLK